MKKILFLVNHDIVIYNFRKELVIKLIEEGYKVYISSPYGKRIDKLVDMGAEFIETTMDRHGTNPLKDMKLYKQYKKIMKNIQPDVVLTYTIKPNIYGGLAARKLKIPYIANITGLGTALQKEGFLQKILIEMYKSAFKSIDTIFVQNEENKKFFIDHNIYPNRLELIPGSGVNLEEFTLLPYPSEDQGIHFAFIARIMKEKGIDEYLKAAEMIKNKYPNVFFHVCGFIDGDYDDIIHEYKKREIIKYHGVIDNTHRFLKNIHCVILPSYYPEGISNILLESAASGRAIITTNQPGCKETMKNRKTGYYVKKQVANDLIEKIIQFLSLTTIERQKMGEFGKKHVSEYFDRTIIVDKYLEKINS